jgi:hypothetical protein
MDRIHIVRSIRVAASLIERRICNVYVTLLNGLSQALIVKEPIRTSTYLVLNKLYLAGIRSREIGTKSIVGFLVYSDWCTL